MPKRQVWLSYKYHVMNLWQQCEYGCFLYRFHRQIAHCHKNSHCKRKKPPFADFWPVFCYPLVS